MGKKSSLRIKRVAEDRPPPLQRITGQDMTPERRGMVDSMIVDAVRDGKKMDGGFKCRQVIPPIQQMLNAGFLNQQEYRALAYYADQANLAERSPLKDSLNRDRGGSGNGELSASVISALLETARIERDLGSLRDIAHAVAVREITVAQWCIERHGGRERYNGKGKLIAIVPYSEKKNVEIARQDLRMAAHRIVR